MTGEVIKVFKDAAVTCFIVVSREVPQERGKSRNFLINGFPALLSAGKSLELFLSVLTICTSENKLQLNSVAVI